MVDFSALIDAGEGSGPSPLPLWASILICVIALMGSLLIVVPHFTGGSKPNRLDVRAFSFFGNICVLVAFGLFLVIPRALSADGDSESPRFDTVTERVYGIQDLKGCDTLLWHRSCDYSLDAHGWPLSMSDSETIDVRYVKDGHIVYGQIILDRPHVTVTDGKGDVLEPQVTVRAAINGSEATR